MIRKNPILSILSIALLFFSVGGDVLVGESAEMEKVPTNGRQENLSHPEFVRLLKAQEVYQEIQKQGGWPQVSMGRAMKRGSSGDRVLALRNRLLVSGDLSHGQTGNKKFDQDLEEAVKRFQRRHGLEMDGVVGPATLEALNISVEERIRQIEINLKRWERTPEDLAADHIAVNIADYRLQVIEGGHRLFEMRVAVGKNYTQTPVFSARMTHLVFRPYWNITKNIAAKEMLPLIKRDPGYLEKNRIQVLRAWGKAEKKIDSKKIDWTKITTKNFPYRFRQEPGPENALGRVKFVLPNRFNVYLHDTPARDLFKKRVREFSHGCIRLDKPVALAEYVLRGNDDWNREKILEAIREGPVNQMVSLAEPIKVHILYWTAWVEEDGTVHFRKDTYNRDEALEEEIEEEKEYHQPIGENFSINETNKNNSGSFQPAWRHGLYLTCPFGLMWKSRGRLG